MDILHKSTTNIEEPVVSNDQQMEAVENNSTYGHSANDDEQLKSLAEQKLVSFCSEILKEASDLQPSTGDAASADVHRVLDLRAPVIIKVNNIFVVIGTSFVVAANCKFQFLISYFYRLNITINFR